MLLKSSNEEEFIKISVDEIESLHSGERNIEVGHFRPKCETGLGKYEALSPAQFFAVTTKWIFTESMKLKKFHPKIYQLLKEFYQQNPNGNFTDQTIKGKKRR